jgi:hypothetical protein
MVAVDPGDSTNNHSSELLLAEHARIAALYQSNADMGDKYVTMYLTIVSFAVGLLLSLNQLAVSNPGLRATELVLLIVVTLIGFTIYERLLVRRVRMIEYLRAINRIHRYFVNEDSRLQDFLSWTADDHIPPFNTTGTFLGGLRDIVILLNSLTCAASIVMFLRMTAPSLNQVFLFMIGALCSMVVFLVLRWRGKATLKKEESKQKHQWHTARECNLEGSLSSDRRKENRG